ncbi:transposase family protein [Burkholderia pseudomallei MSHR4462]|nr:transposase [Burkholderia pseudomallei]KGV25425.1 transposase family protein [Burkholderia pseudomallei MSHR4462]KGX02120.1 transposase family protein [Burkholderia pseudomallei MSHR640]
MKKRFTEQQIIGFLKEAEAGMPVKELCRKHGFSDASFYTWRAKFRFVCRSGIGPCSSLPWLSQGGANRPGTRIYEPRA